VPKAKVDEEAGRSSEEQRALAQSSTVA